MNSYNRYARLTLTALLIGASAVFGFAQQASDMKVDVNLKDADMLAATRALTERTGINFVIKPSPEPFQKITLQVQGVTAEDAIRYICEAAGASFRRDEAGVYIIGHEKADVEGPPVPMAKSPKITRHIVIRNQRATDVYREMVESVPYTSANPFEDMRKFAQVKVFETDISKTTPMPNGNIYGGAISNYAPQAVSPTNLPLTGSETGNQIRLPGESAKQIGGFGGGGGIGGGGLGGGFQGGGGLGGGLGGGGLGGGGGIGGAGGGQVGSQLQGGVGLVPDGIDFISFNPTDNSFIVQGTEDAIAEFQRRVSEFDVPAREVEIKVEYITTSTSYLHDWGSELNFERGTEFAGAVSGTFVSQSDPILFGWQSGNVAFRMRTALTEGKAKIVNAPIVRTMNNTPAIVSSTYESYIFSTQTAATQGVLLESVIPYPYESITALGVDPRINLDGTVTMALAPVVSSILGFTTDPAGNQYPNFITQTVQVITTVRSGHTVVLAGLTSSSDNTNVNKFPVLGDLPIIGQFFRHTTQNNSSNDLLIFVTPTILPLDEDTAGSP